MPKTFTINKEWFKNESELVWIRMNRLYAVNHSWMNHYDEQIRFVYRSGSISKRPHRLPHVLIQVPSQVTITAATRFPVAMSSVVVGPKVIHMHIFRRETSLTKKNFVRPNVRYNSYIVERLSLLGALVFYQGPFG